jgi:hypothetical protein
MVAPRGVLSSLQTWMVEPRVVLSNAWNQNLMHENQINNDQHPSVPKEEIMIIHHVG